MKAITDYPISELKLIYRVLHSQIQENFELMDSSLLQDLQTSLQSLATKDGVDVSLHSDWSAWLNQLATS
ncbi:hypothetical protein MNBD_GAMMA22-1225 [hydrothermal vent metagenome]|uniref:Uncharacterized protein n=1 Tax=hydrothermal vent metagenome TaxID=652676 RepID=A0A3B0ZYI1_9ZZZZ